MLDACPQSILYFFLMDGSGMCLHACMLWLDVAAGKERWRWSTCADENWIYRPQIFTSLRSFWQFAFGNHWSEGEEYSTHDLDYRQCVVWAMMALTRCLRRVLYEQILQGSQISQAVQVYGSSSTWFYRGFHSTRGKTFPSFFRAAPMPCFDGLKVLLHWVRGYYHWNKHSTRYSTTFYGLLGFSSLTQNDLAKFRDTLLLIPYTKFSCFRKTIKIMACCPQQDWWPSRHRWLINYICHQNDQGFVKLYSTCHSWYTMLRGKFTMCFGLNCQMFSEATRVRASDISKRGSSDWHDNTNKQPMCEYSTTLIGMKLRQLYPINTKCVEHSPSCLPSWQMNITFSESLMHSIKQIDIYCCLARYDFSLTSLSSFITTRPQHIDWTIGLKTGIEKLFFTNDFWSNSVSYRESSDSCIMVRNVSSSSLIHNSWSRF